MRRKRDKGEFWLVSKLATIIISENPKGLLLQKTKDGKVLQKRLILMIDSKQAKKYKIIGTARGMNLQHCLYLAGRYAANFPERVCAYSINTAPADTRFATEVAFYEKKL
jgi:hypothetical protein